MTDGNSYISIATIPFPDPALKTRGSYKSDSSPLRLKYVFPNEMVCPENGTWEKPFSNMTTRRSPDHSQGQQFGLQISHPLAAPPGLTQAAGLSQGPPHRTLAQTKALLQLQKPRLKGLLPP